MILLSWVILYPFLLVHPDINTHCAAWETGNELAAVRFGDGPAPAAWTKEIGDLVKSLAPKHLLSESLDAASVSPDSENRYSGS